jgi:hypothetical protein
MTDTIDINMEGLIYPYLLKGNNDTQKTRSSLAGDSQATISGDCTDAEWQANPEGLK